MLRRSLQRFASASALALVFAGCGDDGGAGDGSGDEGGTGGDTESPSSSGGDSADDSASDGSSTGAGSEGSDTEDDIAFDPDAFQLTDVYGVPNLDDDDADGTADWFQYVFDADNDVSTLEIPGVPSGYTVELIASGDLENFRVWDGETFAIGVADAGPSESYRFSPGPDGTTLELEFGDYATMGGLQVRVLGEGDEELVARDVVVMGSPLIMNHHLQPSEGVWVMDVSADFGSNADMVSDFQTVLGDGFDPVDDAAYGWDVWVQDEIEFAISTGNEGQRLNEVIDSIRDRGLDPFPEDEFEGPDFITPTWGNPLDATTWDSFGNLEASPPVTVGDTDYPFGRIYYGKEDGYGMDNVLADFLADQRVQAPFEVDTLWLCVGHVDEFSSFVPDPGSEKGFKFLLADVDAAWEIIDALPPEMELTRYGADHGYATAGDLQDDVGLRALNRDIQDDELDPIHDQFIAELGLDESDIIYIPSLFEDVQGCGVAALIPGMVNLIVSNPVDGPVDLFIPDPFFRTVEGDQSSDPLIEAFTAAMPDGLELHYVDNWDVYHLALGEVHCGTNVLRAPQGEWWTSALHLLETSR